MANDGPAAEPHTPSSNEIQRIRAECTKAVEDYSRGVIGKTQAVFVIASELVGMAAQQSGDTDPTTLQSYLGMLEDIDRARSGHERSELGEGVTNAAVREGTGAGETLTPQSPQPEQESRESSAELEEPPTKRSRADPSQYAWAATDFLLETQLHPHIVRTLELLRNYGEDITQAKRAINSSPSAPEFPDTEWTNVLSGRAVDLDHVFTGRYTPGAEGRVSETIGDLHLSFSQPVASKRISTFGDWVFAWGRATRATTFAFPHRREELVAYGEYIGGLFGALAPAVHGRVLDFDRAVRKRVGSARNLRLTDFESFADLKIQYIDSCGANVFRTEAMRVAAGTQGVARDGPASAVSGMYAPIAAVMDTSSQIVTRVSPRKPSEPAAQPRFLRGFVWSNSNKPAKRFADVSLSHAPVPTVPQPVLDDSVVNGTLKNHPELFAIVTPIKVDRFEELLRDHPNQPFAQSVVRALREGFWPYADAKPDTYPDTWDERRPEHTDGRSAAFLRAQRDEVLNFQVVGCAGPGMWT
ncbi:hypothetical protein ONZ51_g10950 [Trametes cubensis]|uniref:Uncharacterized protein n=1 Tax=Trametes cubensis TaxID=1111947 RepID=A0AAD7TIG6_9APHY|nr:hypothetical protein ONZ51_g10950 [Trametes cubensis]